MERSSKIFVTEMELDMTPPALLNMVGNVLNPKLYLLTLGWNHFAKTVVDERKEIIISKYIASFEGIVVNDDDSDNDESQLVEEN